MTTESSSVDIIKSKFPYKTVEPIPGEPVYTTIYKTLLQLYANAASVPISLGGGAHGHLGLIMATALYSTVTLTPYIPPNDPDLTPNYPVGT